MRKSFLCLLLLALLLSGCGARPEREPASASGFYLDTFVTITLYDGDETTARKALELCGTYETLFSRTDPDSQLCRLNRREISQVSPELAQVISLGLDYARLSAGAFDITAGGLSELWDFSAEEPVLPDGAEVAARLAHVGCETVTVEGNAVTFSDPETVIDLGGIAKGYIADQIAAYLRQEGVTSAIIDLGGNIYCLGSRLDGEPFRVGVQFPYQERSQVIGGLPAAGCSVVTSGVYERGFTLDGRLYHHILDTATGWPVENGLLAVTVVSARSVDGDALSTACFALGLEEGMALAESLEGVEALFITEDLDIRLTSGLEGVFYPLE